MKKLTKDGQKTMKERILVGFILLIIGFPVVLLGGWFLISFIFILLILVVHEFTNAPPHQKYHFALHAFIIVMTYSIVFWIFIKNNLQEHQWVIEKWRFTQGLNELTVSTIGIAVTVGVLALSSIVDKNFKIADATYLTTMVIIVGLSVQSILFLRFYPQFAFEQKGINNPWWSYSFLIMYVLIGNFLSDTGAYFVGVFFGHHQMNPRVSPKKTWEGFFGGVFFSFVFSMGFALIVAKLGYPILPFLTIKEWYWIAFLSLAMPFMSNLGDFTFSNIKRHFDIKDFSTILRSHGGVLDRVDSLLVTSLFVVIIVTFIGSGWNFLA